MAPTCAEFSAVYAGSTPGAMFSRAALDKTERAVAEHIIGADQVTYLEEHYRFFLTPERRHISLPATLRPDAAPPRPKGLITT